jgi:hypothetical protein
VTLIWFVVWLVADLIGDEEPLTFAPVNWWAGALILCIASTSAGSTLRASRSISEN